MVSMKIVLSEDCAESSDDKVAGGVPSSGPFFNHAIVDTRPTVTAAQPPHVEGWSSDGVIASATRQGPVVLVGNDVALQQRQQVYFGNVKQNEVLQLQRETRPNAASPAVAGLSQPLQQQQQVHPHAHQHLKQVIHPSLYGSVTTLTGESHYPPPQQANNAIASHVSFISAGPSSHAACAPCPSQTQVYRSYPSTYPTTPVITHGLLPSPVIDSGTSYVVTRTNPNPANLNQQQQLPNQQQQLPNQQQQHPNQYLINDKFSTQSNVMTHLNGATSGNYAVIHQPNPNHSNAPNTNSMGVSNPVSYVLTHGVGRVPPPFAGHPSAPGTNQMIHQQEVPYQPTIYPNATMTNHASHISGASQILMTSQPSQVSICTNPTNSNSSHDVDTSAAGASNLITHHLLMNSIPTNPSSANVVTPQTRQKTSGGARNAVTPNVLNHSNSSNTMNFNMVTPQTLQKTIGVASSGVPTPTTIPNQDKQGASTTLHPTSHQESLTSTNQNQVSSPSGNSMNHYTIPFNHNQLMTPNVLSGPSKYEVVNGNGSPVDKSQYQVPIANQHDFQGDYEIANPPDKSIDLSRDVSSPPSGQVHNDVSATQNSITGTISTSPLRFCASSVNEVSPSSTGNEQQANNDFIGIEPGNITLDFPPGPSSPEPSSSLQKHDPSFSQDNEVLVVAANGFCKVVPNALVDGQQHLTTSSEQRPSSNTPPSPPRTAKKGCKECYICDMEFDTHEEYLVHVSHHIRCMHPGCHYPPACEAVIRRHYSEKHNEDMPEAVATMKDTLTQPILSAQIAASIANRSVMRYASVTASPPLSTDEESTMVRAVSGHSKENSLGPYSSLMKRSRELEVEEKKRQAEEATENLSNMSFPESSVQSELDDDSKSQNEKSSTRSAIAYRQSAIALANQMKEKKRVESKSIMKEKKSLSDTKRKRHKVTISEESVELLPACRPVTQISRSPEPSSINMNFPSVNEHSNDASLASLFPPDEECSPKKKQYKRGSLVQFCCICRMGFDSHSEYLTHIEDHITCPHPGCYHPPACQEVIAKHFKSVHGGGLLSHAHVTRKGEIEGHEEHGNERVEKEKDGTHDDKEQEYRLSPSKNNSDILSQVIKAHADDDLESDPFNNGRPSNSHHDSRTRRESIVDI